MSYSIHFTASSKDAAVAKVKAEADKNTGLDQSVAAVIVEAISNIDFDDYNKYNAVEVKANGHHCTGKGSHPFTNHSITVTPLVIHHGE